MAEPIVLIPGLMADGRAFAPLIQMLSHERAVHLAVPTGAANVAALAVQVLTHAPARFALIGHGLGASVALEIVHRAPERVTAMVLISACAQPELPAISADQEALIVKARSGSLGAAVLAATGLDGVSSDPARNALVSTVQEMAFDLGTEVFISQLRAMQRRPDQTRAIRKFKCPCLLIGGALDPLFPPKRLEFMENLMPNATLQVAAGTGYWVPLEMPLRLCELVADFLPKPLLLT